jgi:plastocyanin
MRAPFDNGRRGRAMRSAIVLACLAPLALTTPGCGDDDAGAVDAKPLPKVTIVMKDGAYRPGKVRVEAGTRITWVNAGKRPATAETPGAGFYEVDRQELIRRGLFDTHTLQPGEAESLVLEWPGEYRYGNSFNTKMWGVVEVVRSDG